MLNEGWVASLNGLCYDSLLLYPHLRSSLISSHIYSLRQLLLRRAIACYLLLAVRYNQQLLSSLMLEPRKHD